MFGRTKILHFGQAQFHSITSLAIPRGQHLGDRQRPIIHATVSNDHLGQQPCNERNSSQTREDSRADE